MAQTYSDKPTLEAWNAMAGSGGNCKIVCGSYPGNGAYGLSAMRTLTFDAKPVALIIRPETGTAYSGVGHDAGLVAVRDAHWAMPGSSGSTYVEWGAKTVSWYSADGAVNMLNANGTMHHYVALLQTDA